jgi:hypothetical protein
MYRTCIVCTYCQLKDFVRTYFSQIHTIKMHIKFWQHLCNVYVCKDLKNLTPWRDSNPGSFVLEADVITTIPRRHCTTHLCSVHDIIFLGQYCDSCADFCKNNNCGHHTNPRSLQKKSWPKKGHTWSTSNQPKYTHRYNASVKKTEYTALFIIPKMCFVSYYENHASLPTNRWGTLVKYKCMDRAQAGWPDKFVKNWPKMYIAEPICCRN